MSGILTGSDRIRSTSYPKIVLPLKAFLDKRHELWWDPMGSVDHDFNENVLPLQACRYL